MAVKSSRSLGLAYFNTKDINLGGVFRESLDYYKAGTEIDLSFSLPGNPKPIKVRGKVIYVLTEELTGDSDLVPGMGVKFLNLEENDKKLLAACLENY
jgi:Tfp pilus assembly protein PilZ